MPLTGGNWNPGPSLITNPGQVRKRNWCSSFTTWAIVVSFSEIRVHHECLVYYICLLAADICHSQTELCRLAVHDPFAEVTLDMAEHPSFMK